MEFSSSILNYKGPSIRIKSSLSRYKSANGVNNQENLSQIKELLKRYLDSPLTKFDLKEENINSKQCLKRVRINKNNLRQNYFNHSAKQEKPILFGPFSIHCKSPTLKFRKIKAKSPKSMNNSSMIVQKMSYSRNVTPKCPSKLQLNNHRKQNSSYSSYSDIYKCLLEKVPLK